MVTWLLSTEVFFGPTHGLESGWAESIAAIVGGRRNHPLLLPQAQGLVPHSALLIPFPSLLLSTASPSPHPAPCTGGCCLP